MKNKFLGWQVLAGCIICMFLVQGDLQTFAVFLPQIVEDTGWSLTMVAQVSTLASGSAFLAGMALTPALKRISARTALVIGAAFIMIHNGVYCFSPTVYVLWLGAILGGIAIGWGTMAGCSIIITNWFTKNRSQFIAAAVAGSMLGSVFLNTAAALLIEAFGWRMAYLLLGGCTGGTAVIIILLFVRDRPEPLGQQPYGGYAGPADEHSGFPGGLSQAQASSSLSYKLLIPGIFLMGFSTNVENYMSAFWQQRGIEPVKAAMALSVYSLAAALLSPFLSRINDRLGGKRYIALSFLCFAGPLMIMSHTGVCGSFFLLLLCCVPFAGGAKKAVTMVPSLVVAESFGRKGYSRIIGPFAAVLQLGIAGSNLLIGPLAAKSYGLAFTVMALLNLAGAALVVTALQRKPYSSR